MDRTRRSLCGLGIASVPLAIIAPKLLPAAQEPAAGTDPLLAYLAAETRRHCREAARPGEPRAPHVRALASNAGMLAVYLQSRVPLATIEAGIKRRLQREGSGVLAQSVRDGWPHTAERVESEFGVALARELDEGALSQALANVERYGFPRLGGIRRWLEAEANRLDRHEGRGVATAPVRQTPGNDYGPGGWNAGIGDPNQPSCSDLGVLMAAMGMMELIPELGGIVRPMIAALAFGMAIACSPWAT